MNDEFAIILITLTGRDCTRMTGGILDAVHHYLLIYFYNSFLYSTINLCMKSVL